MDTRELGRSGVAVSRIILGCGNFGGIGSAPHLFDRGTGRDDAFAIMDAAVDLGITCFDTADAYGGGRSETYIGAWLAQRGAAVRERIVVATKTFNPMDVGEDSGLAAPRVRRQVAASLQRLGLERLPLFLTHDWDPVVPIEETVGVLDELVREGVIGAVGCSNVSAEQLAEALEISRIEALTRFEWVQNGFSLLQRGDRETLFPVLHEHGLGYTPFSPLAGGWLTGKYRRDEEPPAGSRMTLRPEGSERYRRAEVFDALDLLAAEAADRGVSTAGLALAWALATPEVTAVVIGPRDVTQLAPITDALSVGLSRADHERLETIFP